MDRTPFMATTALSCAAATPVEMVGSRIQAIFKRLGRMCSSKAIATLRKRPCLRPRSKRSRKIGTRIFSNTSGEASKGQTSRTSSSEEVRNSNVRRWLSYAAFKVTSGHVSNYIAMKFTEDNQRGSVEALRLVRPSILPRFAISSLLAGR
ncbi:hypothetical protein C8R45DRAFT_523157 [Mycena sanguinolenta]|nr:hypothetical protein C8R45DRAFT_523157 [Mycena sanguinolenta]